MNEFGNLLRKHREDCHDPFNPMRKLSQVRLGEILGNELGTQGYSGAAVSDWERGKSKIHADERLVLVSLIKVLHDCGGLVTLEQANHLLTMGNYRALDTKDAERIFAMPLDASDLVQPKPLSSKSFTPYLIGNLFFMTVDEFQDLLAKAEEGPAPAWPRMIAALMRKAFEHLSFVTIVWLWIWLIAWWLIAPSLRLPFGDQGGAVLAVVNYVGGTLIIPLMIGLLVNTKDNAYWKEQGMEDTLLLRLYTYQGAGIGFNLGYFLILPFSLLRYYLHLEPTPWIEISAVTLGLILGNMASRVTPYNLWRAYGRLALADGGIFFVVAFLGPLWGFFFLEFYSVLLTPVLGVIVILLSLTLTAFITTRQKKSQT
jgi:hypothetical protein